MIGDFNPEFAPHPATKAAIRHAADFLGLTVEIHGCRTDSTCPVRACQLAQFAGLWASPGSPYRNIWRWVGRHPLRGRQHARAAAGHLWRVAHTDVEFARNVGFADAAHAEHRCSRVDAVCHPVVVLARRKILPIRLLRELSCRRRTARWRRSNATTATSGCTSIHCTSGGFAFVGTDAVVRPCILELPAHRFYVVLVLKPAANRAGPTP